MASASTAGLVDIESDLMEHVLGVVLVGAAGIQLGTLWIMKLSILPMLNSLPYDNYVNVCHRIDMHIFHPVAVWMGVTAAALGVVAAAVSGSFAVGTLFIVGSIGMVVVGIASEGFNRPIWRQIEKWSVDAEPAAGWVEKRRTWHLAHQVRTYGAIGATAAYAAALMLAL